MIKTYQTHTDVPGVSNSKRKLERLKIPADLTGKRVLDIGCNEGFFCAEFARRGAREVVGVDRNKPALDFARKHYGNLPINFINQSWDELPEGPFDLVLWSSAIHYEPEPGKILRNIESLLSPEGVLILECGVTATSRKEMEIVPRKNDSLLFPTMSYLMEELLAPFSTRRQSQGETTDGDPTPRYVFHCYRKRPTVVLLRGNHNDGKTYLSNLLTTSASKVISLDLFISRLGRSKFQHSETEKYLQEKMPARDLSAVYRGIDAAGLTKDYARQIRRLINSTDELVVIEGYMTELQLTALTAELNDHAVVWDTSRVKV
ncbi:class I SAM-dependent methyltransferase [Brevundimonas diminuta]|nr:class I SAM-dependent methyltransferase [Brevundimonas diminuta]MCO8022244.1 class I SAM-dependent methyltransferase [Brevundimonas diminuta]